MSPVPEPAREFSRDVGPGCQTGLYYIIVANLPFGTKWRDLKDWLRNSCFVEHVEVFNGSTSGWVRVKGQDNYDKAMVLFDKKEFKGRILIADGRNSTERVKIRDAVSGTPKPKPPPPKAKTSKQASRPRRPPPTSRTAYRMPMRSPPLAQPIAAFSGPWPPAAPPGANGPFGSFAPFTPTGPQPPPRYNHPGTFCPPSSASPSYNSAAATPGYQYNKMEFQGPHAPPFQGPFDFPSQLPPPFPHSHPHPRPLPPAGLGNHVLQGLPGHNPPTSGTKRVQIRHLGHTTPEDEVRKLVQNTVKKLTPDSTALQHIDFPRDQNGRPKGNVFATLRTHDLALRVAGELNGRAFLHKRLEARLADEKAQGPGCAPPPAPARSNDKKNTERRRHRFKRDQNEQHKNRQKDKDKDKDKENVQPSPAALLQKLTLEDDGHVGARKGRTNYPVIADGSSRSSVSPDSEQRA